MEINLGRKGSNGDLLVGKAGEDVDIFCSNTYRVRQNGKGEKGRVSDLGATQKKKRGDCRPNICSGEKEGRKRETFSQRGKRERRAV